MPKLSPTHILPATSGITDSATKAWADRMNTFLDDILRKISLADNISQIKEVELIKDGSTGGDDGNWKIVMSGTALLVQNKASGSWVDEFKWSPSS